MASIFLPTRHTHSLRCSSSWAKDGVGSDGDAIEHPTVPGLPHDPNDPKGSNVPHGRRQYGEQVGDRFSARHLRPLGGTAREEMHPGPSKLGAVGEEVLGVFIDSVDRRDN
jgi:hypothetical protein